MPPSPDSGVTEPVVWAIAEQLLHNYLLPRDCPRVTYYAKSTTTDSDRDAFFKAGGNKHVVAIESKWATRVHNTHLSLYELPIETFSCAVFEAGYYISRTPVMPIKVQKITDVMAELSTRDVELRILSSLWPLRDAVLASSLAFSFIRMRNATARATTLHSSNL
jgi:hypothetical protein